MVMKYAMGEKEVIMQKKAREDMEKKLTATAKERDDCQAKLKALQAEKNRLQQVADSRVRTQRFQAAA